MEERGGSPGRSKTGVVGMVGSQLHDKARNLRTSRKVTKARGKRVGGWSIRKDVVLGDVGR
jgi:hypothetical protein